MADVTYMEVRKDTYEELLSQVKEYKEMEENLKGSKRMQQQIEDMTRGIKRLKEEIEKEKEYINKDEMIQLPVLFKIIDRIKLPSN